MCRPIWVSELGCRQPKLVPCLLIPHVFFIHSDVVIYSFILKTYIAPFNRQLFIHTENLHSTPSVDYYSFSHSGDLKYYIVPFITQKLLSWNDCNASKLYHNNITSCTSVQDTTHARTHTHTHTYTHTHMHMHIHIHSC